MVLEGSQIYEGKVAKIVSETVVDEVDGYCFSFFFSMHDGESNALNISTIYEGTGEQTAIWFLVGEKGRDWIYGQVN